MEYLQHNESVEDARIVLMRDRTRKNEKAATLSTTSRAQNRKYDTFDIPLEKPVKKKLSGAQRRKKAIINALSQGLPILTPVEIRKNLNAYGRHSSINYEQVRLQRAEQIHSEIPGTSSEGNPYKWISPSFRSMQKPAATVTSQTNQVLHHGYRDIENSSFKSNLQHSGSDYRNATSAFGNSNDKNQYLTSGTASFQSTVQDHRSRMLAQQETPHTANVGFVYFDQEEPERLAKLGIAHSNHPLSTLSDDQCKFVESGLLYKILECEDGTGPQFKNLFVQDNIIWLTVVNESSKNWLYKHIPHFKPWQGASLKVGRPFEMKGLVKVGAYLPPSMNDMEPDKILQLLKSQNKGLDTEKWNILRTVNEVTGRTIIFQIDDESLKVLQKLSFQPYLGLAQVTFEIKQ